MRLIPSYVQNNPLLTLVAIATVFLAAAVWLVDITSREHTDRTKSILENSDAEIWKELAATRNRVFLFGDLILYKIAIYQLIKDGRIGRDVQIANLEDMSKKLHGELLRPSTMPGEVELEKATRVATEGAIRAVDRLIEIAKNPEPKNSDTNASESPIPKAPKAPLVQSAEWLSRYAYSWVVKHCFLEAARNVSSSPSPAAIEKTLTDRWINWIGYVQACHENKPNEFRMVASLDLDKTNIAAKVTAYAEPKGWYQTGQLMQVTGYCRYDPNEQVFLIDYAHVRAIPPRQTTPGRDLDTDPSMSSRPLR